LTYCPHPILAAEGRQLIYVPYVEGETIGRYLDRVGIRMTDAPAVLMVNGQRVPSELWHMARPKPGTTITLRVQLEGGGDSNPIAAIAMIALAIFAPGIGQLGVGMLSSATGMAFTATTGMILSAAISGAVVLVGGILINSLFAPPVAQLSQARAPQVSPTYSLSGGRNSARPYGPLPLILGTHRVFPDLASKPYTEFAGDEQYLIQTFNFGFGTLQLSDFRVGQTALTSYTEVVTEQSGTDGVLYKFPGNVDSTIGGVLGSGTPAVQYPTPTDDTAWVSRTSGTNAIRLAIDIEATIYRIDSEGMGEWFVTLEAHYRPVGGAWSLFPGFEQGAYLPNSDTRPIRKTYYSGVLTPGQYEVRVKRALGEGDPWELTQVTDSVTWATLRTYQLDPSSYDAQNRYGIWIKASGQINGVMDRLSALAEAYIPTWNGSAWVNAYSSNCAWVFLYFARGATTAAGRPLWGCNLADSRIDIEGLKLWGSYCTAHGLTFNAVIDTPMSQAEVLNAIARCGRGSVTFATGKLGVVWDDSEAPVVAQFGMSSIRAASFSIEWATAPMADEIVLEFQDDAEDFEQSEVRVLRPGTSTPERSQTVQWFGVTNRFMAGQMANLLMANNLYRTRSIKFETDAEGLIVTRGDRIMLSHDLTQWGYSGRLTAATITRLDLDREIPRVLGTAAWIALIEPDGSETYHALTDVASGDYAYVTLVTPLSAGGVPGTAFPSSPLFDWRWRFDYQATPGKRVKIAAIEPLGERHVRISCVDDPVEYHGASVLGATYIARSATQPATPSISGLRTDEVLVNVAGSVATRLICTWNTTGEVGATRVRWHANDGVWVSVGDVAGRRVEFSVADRSTITVEVSVFNSVGMMGLSGVATDTHYVVGKTALPPTPQYFLVSGQADGTRQLAWGYTTINPPLDVTIGGGYRVRYVSGASGTWASMSALHTGLLIASPFEFNTLAAGTWTFAVKAVDSSGNESADALYATAVLLDPRLGGVIYAIDPFTVSWPGTKTACWRDPITGWLEANSTDTWATLPPWESWNQWTSNPVTSFVYQHSTIDVGVVTSFTPNASCIGIGSFLVEEQHSDDNSSYSGWATAGVKISGRYVRLRVTVTPTVADQAMHLESMQIALDAKTIQEWINDSVVQPAGWTKVTTGKYRVPITQTYAVIQQVSISFQSATEAGWTYLVLDKNITSGPQIQFTNPSGAAADPTGTVDVYIKGL
jgi:hypothetical protein